MPATKRVSKKSANAAEKVPKPLATRVAKAKKRPATAKRAAGAAEKTTTSRKRSAPAKSGDAIAVLKQDHRRVEQLFKRLEKAGEGAHRTKRALVDTVIEALSRHAAIEELVFYPAIRREVGDAEADVLEALEEHHLVKVGLHELEDLDPADKRFDAKVSVLIENVRHHVKDEEQELFPEVREQLGRRRLHELADELRAAKPRVPTRPHPDAPDEPPGNALFGGAVAVVDRARSVGQRVVGRVREEVPIL
jgi:hemerythrin-like domain-containing protein